MCNRMCVRAADSSSSHVESFALWRSAMDKQACAFRGQPAGRSSNPWDSSTSQPPNHPFDGFWQIRPLGHQHACNVFRRLCCGSLTHSLARSQPHTGICFVGLALLHLLSASGESVRVRVRAVHTLGLLRAFGLREARY